MSTRSCPACGFPTTGLGRDRRCGACIITNTKPITSPTYVHADCGCDYRDGEQIRWCAHHVSGLQETIRARDKSIAEYSTKARVLEAEVATKDRLIENISAERDEAQRVQHHYIKQFVKEHDAKNALREEVGEWKAKAEQVAEEAERRHQNTLASICPNPDAHKDNPATHWCCMHMRYETPKGEEV